MPEGRCHCGAVAYAVTGEAKHNAICHCEDCRRCSGAVMTSWIAYSFDDLTVTKGQPKIYPSSEGVERHFCGDCGTGLFYYNEAMLPGLVDIQSVTLDDAANHPPQAHIQMADSLAWETDIERLPRFDRYPG